MYSKLQLCASQYRTFAAYLAVKMRSSKQEFCHVSFVTLYQSLVSKLSQLHLKQSLGFALANYILGLGLYASSITINKHEIAICKASLMLPWKLRCKPFSLRD